MRSSAASATRAVVAEQPQTDGKAGVQRVTRGNNGRPDPGFMYGVGKGLIKLTPPGILFWTGYGGYALGTSLRSDGFAGTAANIASGIAAVPSHLVDGWESDNPAIRGEAIVDTFAILSGLGGGAYSIGDAIANSGRAAGRLATEGAVAGYDGNFARIIADQEMVSTPQLGASAQADVEFGTNALNSGLSVEQAIKELLRDGHGVQRHGPQVTIAQLENRAIEGIDPITGTQIDGVHGGIHSYAQHATKVVSEEAYVFAEQFARNSQQYIDAISSSITGRAEVQIRLIDIFGDEFRDYVTGVSRYGLKSAPTGGGATYFGNDSYMVIRYKQGPDGNWQFNTMFPQPN